MFGFLFSHKNGFDKTTCLFFTNHKQRYFKDSCQILKRACRIFTGFPAFSVIRYQSGYPAMSHPVSSRIPDIKKNTDMIWAGHSIRCIRYLMGVDCLLDNPTGNAAVCGLGPLLGLPLATVPPPALPAPHTHSGTLPQVSTIPPPDPHCR